MFSSFLYFAAHRNCLSCQLSQCVCCVVSTQFMLCFLNPQIIPPTEWWSVGGKHAFEVINSSWSNILIYGCFDVSGARQH